MTNDLHILDFQLLHRGNSFLTARDKDYVGSTLFLASFEPHQCHRGNSSEDQSPRWEAMVFYELQSLRMGLNWTVVPYSSSTESTRPYKTFDGTRCAKSRPLKLTVGFFYTIEKQHHQPQS